MNASMLSVPQKKLVRLCFGMEVILLLSLGAVPVVCGFWLFLPFSVPADEQSAPLLQEGSWHIRESTLFILDSLVIFLVLLQMLFFVKGVRHGWLFSLNRVRNIRHIGLTLVSGYCLCLAVRTLFPSSFGEGINYGALTLVSIELDSLQQLLIGAGLLALSCIFEQARVLYDEQKLVI